MVSSPVKIPGFVKQHDRYGKLLPGVLTNHKGNLVSYFKRALNEGRVFMASQISSVAMTVKAKYEQGAKVFPAREHAANTLETLQKQLGDFCSYVRGTKTIYSGKRIRKNCPSTDDLVMALIIAVAWARLPYNHYIVSK